MIGCDRFTNPAVHGAIVSSAFERFEMLEFALEPLSDRDRKTLNWRWDRVIWQQGTAHLTYPFPQP